MIKKSSLWILAGLLVLVSCVKPPVDPVDPNENTKPKISGTLEIEFRVPGSFLPPSRVLRADLSVAKDAESLYRGHFLQMANVYNSKLVYQFDLAPGVYYYQAGIICIAEGDSCSAASFPGGKFGMKWAIGTTEVKQDKTTHVVPQFTR
ncbi:MAG: hypothetical protein WC699_12660 [Bacteroidales bacterium]|jgi:hypothetical protein